MNRTLRQYITKTLLLLVMLAMGGNLVLPYLMEQSCERHHYAGRVAEHTSCHCCDHYHDHHTSFEAKCSCDRAIDLLQYATSQSNDSQLKSQSVAPCGAAAVVDWGVDNSLLSQLPTQILLFPEVIPLYRGDARSALSLRAPPVLS